MLLLKYINSKKVYSKLGADLDISGSVFETIQNQIVLLGPTWWSSDQYSRDMFLKISRLSSKFKDF